MTSGKWEGGPKLRIFWIVVIFISPYFFQDPDIVVLALTLCYKKDGTDIWKELHLSNNNIKEKKIVLNKMKSWQTYNVKLKMTANGVDVESDTSSVLVKGKGSREYRPFQLLSAYNKIYHNVQ